MRGTVGRFARRLALWLPAALLLLAVAASPAQAHKPSDSYLRLDAEPSGDIKGQWRIALRDLDQALTLDVNDDGQITWGEVRTRHAEIAVFALARLAITRGGAACTATAGEQLVEDLSDGAYTVMPFSAVCGAAVGTPDAAPGGTTLQLDYRLFADTDPLHRGLLSLSSGGAAVSAVLDPNGGAQRFVLQAPDRWRQFTQYLWEGVWHIWIGLDHILFLLSLLLPAVLVWRGEERRWVSAPSLRVAAIDVLKIVTAFTVAHSITLTLATLGVVTLPSAFVESVIAASVVAAALNNVWPLFQGRRWAMAFAFGLVHGFGFASVLADLGLPQGSLLLALVAFNVGVELGQLAIVALFLPLAFALRGRPLYRRGVLVGGSLVIAALAAVWFCERAFGLQLMPAIG